MSCYHYYLISLGLEQLIKFPFTNALIQVSLKPLRLLIVLFIVLSHSMWQTSMNVQGTAAANRDAKIIREVSGVPVSLDIAGIGLHRDARVGLN